MNELYEKYFCEKATLGKSGIRGLGQTRGTSHIEVIDVFRNPGLIQVPLSSCLLHFAQTRNKTL
jgi:hypothetical protein